MIRINLLKTQVKRKKPEKVRGSSRPVWLIASLISFLVFAAGVAGISWYFIKNRNKAPIHEVAEVPFNFKPSTHVKPNMVEDVVGETGVEQNRSIASGFLDLAYEDMSSGEKINYEVLYAKYVTELLARAVPNGIGLKELDMDNFQSIYAVGLGPSRTEVSTMFSSFKQERVELLAPPYSYIKSNGSRGFRFIVTCKTRFGLDLTDPFQAIDFIISRDDVPMLIKKVATYAGQDGIVLKGDPVQISGEKTSSYRRIVFHMTGSCSYKDFVKFVIHLYKDRIPCAFKKLTLKAYNGNSVEMSADCIFTARD